MILTPLTWKIGRSVRARKNGLNICFQQEKSYQNEDLFYMGFEKVLKMQVSVIYLRTSSIVAYIAAKQ